EFRITSAHRTPDETAEYARTAKSRGVKVIIAAAGMAAALPGAAAAQTELPVIGVPISSGGLGGLDALLSMVQMPGGVPVGTVGLDKAGAKNAAVLAARILAIGDKELGQRLGEWAAGQSEKVRKASEELSRCRKPKER
ncbi:MAG: 5-(carboxyamino)imidazole ribonucleotide mutase, partial [Planctomycetes bacterium]|nr:5-(carboxyamino)imidazole ribonucleotide mutase [Planctomycetota bacterium]